MMQGLAILASIIEEAVLITDTTIEVFVNDGMVWTIDPAALTSHAINPMYYMVVPPAIEWDYVSPLETMAWWTQ